MLEGAVCFDPDLALLTDENVVVRRDLPVPAKRSVALLSGGGSGHEPAHWAEAFVLAVDKITELGGAKPGD
jgi:dihydroxyacetone kinase